MSLSSFLSTPNACKCCSSICEQDCKNESCNAGSVGHAATKEEYCCEAEHNGSGGGTALEGTLEDREERVGGEVAEGAEGGDFKAEEEYEYLDGAAAAAAAAAATAGFT